MISLEEYFSMLNFHIENEYQISEFDKENLFIQSTLSITIWLGPRTLYRYRELSL